MLCSLTGRTHASGTCQRPAAVACRPAPSGTVVARSTPRQQQLQQLQQQLQFEQDKKTWFTAESRWRLFGFGATACSERHGSSVDGTEYVSMAAYDLASGELFNTLINLKLHDPGYRFLASRLQGLSKEEVLSEGVHALAAFHQLVDFVHNNTPPGKIPVIAAHQGFELTIKHVEQWLQRAAAAKTAGRAGPTTTKAMGSSGSSVKSRSKSSRSVLEPFPGEKFSAPGSSSSSSNTSTVYQHSSWPQEWTFLDTYVMAQVLQSLPPSERDGLGGNILQQKLRRGLYEMDRCGMPDDDRLLDDSLGALDALLLPQRQHSAGPRDRALHAAVSTARLAQLLLTLMEEVPEELVMSLPPNEKRSLFRDDERALFVELMQWQHYSCWVCQPYCLNPADHQHGRFPYQDDSDYSWLQYIPSSMKQAGRKATEAPPLPETRKPVSRRTFKILTLSRKRSGLRAIPSSVMTWLTTS